MTEHEPGYGGLCPQVHINSAVVAQSDSPTTHPADSQKVGNILDPKVHLSSGHFSRTWGHPCNLCLMKVRYEDVLCGSTPKASCLSSYFTCLLSAPGGRRSKSRRHES